MLLEWRQQLGGLEALIIDRVVAEFDFGTLVIIDLGTEILVPFKGLEAYNLFGNLYAG